MAKNRLMFEPDDPAAIQPKEFDQEAYLDQESDAVFLDNIANNRAKKFRKSIIGGLVGLLILLIGGISYYIYSSRQVESQSQESRISLDQVKDRYYLPEANLTDQLKKGRQQYLQAARDAARRTFQTTLDSSTDDTERSIAHVYLGVMALEEDRFGQARHHFLSAEKLDSNSVAALVNLAIVERKLGNRESALDYANRARKLAPNDAVVATILANLFLEASDLAKAEELYREGIDSSPNDSIIRYNLALSLIRQNKLDEAELEFNRLIELSPSDPLSVKALAYLGQIAFMKNRPEQAIGYYKRAIALSPDEARYHYNLGVIFLRINDNQSALQSFDKALKAGGSDPQVFQNLSTAYSRLNEPELAIKALNRALMINPQSIESLFQLGDLYYSKKDLLSAADTYRKIVNITPGDKNTEDALLKLGKVYRDMERYQESADVLHRAATMSPNNANLLYELGLTYKIANQFDKAVQVWKKAIDSGMSIDRADERMIRLALGDSFRSKGAYDLAIQQYKLIEAKNKENPPITEDAELSLRLGSIYKSLNDAGSSATYYRQVFDGNEATPTQKKDAAKDMAQLYLKDSSRDSLDQASSWAYKAARLDQTDAETQILRAEILLKSESGVDREKAIEILLALTYGRVPAGFEDRTYLLLGDAYYQNGEYRRAIEAYDTAQDFAPNNSEILKKKRIAVSQLRSGER